MIYLAKINNQFGKFGKNNCVIQNHLNASKVKNLAHLDNFWASYSYSKQYRNAKLPKILVRLASCLMPASNF